MYSRLTPRGRGFRFIILKFIGWTTAAVTLAGGVVTAARSIEPSVSSWWNRQSVPRINSPPPMMATTPRQQPAISIPPTLLYAPRISPPIIYSHPTPTFASVYSEPLVVEQPKLFPPIVRPLKPKRDGVPEQTKDGDGKEKMPPVHHKHLPKTPPAESSPPGKRGKR